MKKEIYERKNIFWVLTGGIVLSLGLYFYFVSHTIYSVVERQKTEKAISALENEIEKAELTYSNLKAKVTISLAQSKGFENISAATYISRKSLGKGLTVHNEI